MASCLDTQNRQFSSWADYELPAHGFVEPGKQAPVDGLYAGVDPHGLWWTMTSGTDEAFIADLAPIATTLTASVDSDVVACQTFDRVWMGPGVSVSPLVEDGLVGSLFLPSRRPARGVVVIGGSDGGTRSSEGVAALLASHGFAALALAYFGVEGLPDTLADIPIEYCGAAVSWLACHAAVGGDRVGIVGASRGGELALLVGSSIAQVSAVVGLAPSVVVWGGFPAGTEGRPAWTKGGRGLPWAVASQVLPGPSPNAPPLSQTDVYLAALTDPSAARAVIPVERTRGPILIVTGDSDRIWPASQFAEICMRRLRAARHAYPDRHLCYPAAGHTAGRPPGLPVPLCLVHPVDGIAYELGGTLQGNALSRADAWPQVLRFLWAHVPVSGGESAPIGR